MFAPKCSAKITVCYTMQNLCQLVKYSLTNSRNWLHVFGNVSNLSRDHFIKSLIIFVISEYKLQLLWSDRRPHVPSKNA